MKALGVSARPEVWVLFLLFCSFAVLPSRPYAQALYADSSLNDELGTELLHFHSASAALPNLQSPTKPAVISRTAWKCPDGQNSPGYPEWAYTKVTHIVIHHSDEPSASSDWPGVLRAIYADHKSKYGDIGYNYLIDPHGVVYEGRAGGDNVIGAHFSCVNSGTMGVCLLGNFERVYPTDEALASLKQLIAWKVSLIGMDPTQSAYHRSSQLTLPNICGHYHANQTPNPDACPKGTPCPGKNLIMLLESIRADVKRMAHTSTVDQTPPVINSFYPQPERLAEGEEVKIHFQVEDAGGSGLGEVLLMRNDSSSAESDTRWTVIDRLEFSGNGSADGVFTDQPLTGSHWYGLQVIDVAKNRTDERRSLKGPDLVTVTDVARINLEYAGSRVHDGDGGGRGNRDEIVNPGEEIDLDIQLLNDGKDSAKIVSANLFTPSEYVTITEADVRFDDISAGEARWGRTDFDFAVSSKTPFGEKLKFILRLEFEGGSLEREFSLTVFGDRGNGEIPAIEVTAPSIVIPSGTSTATVGQNTDFGEHTIGNGPSHNFEVWNRGTASLRLADPPITFEGSPAFSVKLQPSMTIGRGRFSNFIIDFEATSVGVHTAVLHIASNDPKIPDYNFVVRGVGKERPRRPSIFQHPESQTVDVGDTVVLSVRAIGSDLSYQWNFNGLAIPGEEKADLVLRNVSEAAAGTYMAIVRGSAAAASNAAKLEVRAPSLTLGDLDGDGRGDLLFQNQIGRVATWLMAGDTQRKADFLASVAVGPWKMIAIADFEVDGKSDILFQHVDGTLAIWRMDQNQMASAQIILSNPGNQWRAVSVARMDKDEHPDILFQHTTGFIAVWMMDDLSLVSAKYVTSKNPGTSWQVVGTGDFNDDRNTDLLFQHSDGQLCVWLLDGLEYVSSKRLSTLNPGGTWRVVSVLNLDRKDGRDIVFQNESADLVAWFMNGLEIERGAYLTPRNPGVTWRVVGPR